MTTSNLSGASVAPSPAATTDTSTSSTITDPTAGLANESAFLQLLVAQIKNQDPMNPSDGTQFLTQLAQFSSLEQQLQMNSQLTDIKNEIANLKPATTP